MRPAPTPTLDRSLRIALVVDPFRLKLKGGDHAPSIARELLGRGHTVRGFGAPPGTIPRSRSLPTADDAGADGGPGLLGFRPDVIVAYDALSPAAWNGARRAGRLRVPLVLVEEGFPEEGRRIERALRWTGERLWGPYVRRRAAAVVGLDQVAADQAIAEGFPPERVSTLPAGVDLTRYRPGLTSHIPSRHGIRGRILLHVGHLSVDCGLDVVIRAFASTVGRRGDWSLVLAGDGPAGRRLRALTYRYGVGAQVHWIGPARREELPGLLGAATLLIAPSLDHDVTGWRLRRALAAGLPVLAGRGPRAEAMIEHDGCGLVVAKGDPAAWTEALRIAVGSPSRRQRWRDRARRIAEERYAWPRVAARFEELLLDACTERQRAPATARDGA